MKQIEKFSSLTIGSVPFLSTQEALNSLNNINIPASPQLVKANIWEDMLLSAVNGLPTISVENRKIISKKENRAEKLTSFYEKFLNDDFDFLFLNEKSQIGFSAFLKKAKEDKNFGPHYLKSQVVGPLTFAQATNVEDAYKLVDDPELLELVSQAIGVKGALLAQKINNLGRKAIIFLDEPGLTGYGSAFSTLSADKVLKTLNNSVEIIQNKSQALVGLHVCGNTDWGLLLKSKINIINLDAYSYAENFILYPKEILNFLNKGGYIAWGIVPTQDFNESITAEFLAEKLKTIWENLASKGLKVELIRERSLITSSCGLGTLEAKTALNITKTMALLSQYLKENF